MGIGVLIALTLPGLRLIQRYSYLHGELPA